MPIPASCSSCGWNGKLKDEFAGKRGRCPACREIIQVPAPESEAEYGDYEVVDDDPPPQPAVSKRARDDDDDRPSRSRLPDDDDGDNWPRSRRRIEDDDDDNSRPQSRFHKAVADERDRPLSRRRDEDDEDNRPRSRRRDDDDESSSKPRSKIKKKKKKDDAEQPHQLTGTAAMFGGIGMMIGAIVWFVLGIVYQDKIYFFPPILFVMGIGAFIRGMQEESDRH